MLYLKTTSACHQSSATSLSKANVVQKALHSYQIRHGAVEDGERETFWLAKNKQYTTTAPN